jgi:hypothetical protein
MCEAGCARGGLGGGVCVCGLSIPRKGEAEDRGCEWAVRFGLGYITYMRTLAGFGSGSGDMCRYGQTPSHRIASPRHRTLLNRASIPGQPTSSIAMFA